MTKDQIARLFAILDEIVTEGNWREKRRAILAAAADDEHGELALNEFLSWFEKESGA